MSSNFPSNYLKIGHPFSSYGWPESYSNHRPPIVSLSDIRSLITSKPSSYLLGGHSFLGLESFLSGSSDIWMNYRDPLMRLNSGIYRFYSKQYKHNVNPSSKHLITASDKDINFSSPESISHLLDNALIHESNGMARRLSACSLSKNFHMNENSNIETMEILRRNDFDYEDLLHDSIENLSNIKVLINSKWLQASLLCIEKIYNLNSPLINPFSNLKHNPVTLSGISRNDTRLMTNCRDILLEHTSVDRALFPHLNQIFAEQVNQNSIDLKDIAVRDAIHCDGLFNPDWFLINDTTDISVTAKNVGNAFVTCCKNNHELSDSIFNTLMRWNVLDDNFRILVAKHCRDKHAFSSVFV